MGKQHREAKKLAPGHTAGARTGTCRQVPGATLLTVRCICDPCGNVPSTSGHMDLLCPGQQGPEISRLQLLLSHGRRGTSTIKPLVTWELMVASLLGPHRETCPWLSGQKLTLCPQQDVAQGDARSSQGQGGHRGSHMAGSRVLGSKWGYTGLDGVPPAPTSARNLRTRP